MIPSSLELNSDDFPFFGDLKRTSESREKLQKSSFKNRDNHHWPRAKEQRRKWWRRWCWRLNTNRNTEIQKKEESQKSKNPTIQKIYFFFVNRWSPKNFGHFDTSGSLVALLFPKIWTEIQKKGRNREIQKSKNPKKLIFFVNL